MKNASHGLTLPNYLILLFLFWTGTVCPDDVPVIRTPDSKWIVAEELPAVERADPDLQPLSIDLDSTKIQPQLRTRRQFLETTLGADSLRRAIDSKLPEDRVKFDQVIEGIPRQFLGERFEQIRRGFDPECVREAGQLRELLGDIAVPSPADVHHSIDGDLDYSQKARLRAAIRSYDVACLKRWQDELPNQIARGLGVLVAHGAPFCSATLIGNTQLLTARHCFIKSGDGTAAESMNLLERGSVFFMPLDANQSSRPLFAEVGHEDMERPPQPPEAYGITSDFLYLTLEKDIQDRALPVGGDEVDILPGELVYLVGYNSLLTVLWPVPIDAGFPTDLDQHVRLAPPETCAIIATTPQGCLFHSCQTAGGTSGAALVRQRDGRVIGVHTGAGYQTDECPMGDLPVSALNVATAIRQL